MKKYTIALILILPFVLNLKIYKYKIADGLPPCVESGRYFDMGKFTIGFSSDRHNKPVSGAIELSGIEFVNYVASLGITELQAQNKLTQIKKMYDEIVETPNFSGTFLGKEVHTKEDVNRVTSEHIANLQGGREDQLKMIGDILCLLLAYQGKITFAEAGIASVTNMASADTYVTNLYQSVWLERNNIRQQAKQYIIDNNLQ